jgi:hypothetical protein
MKFTRHDSITEIKTTFTHFDEVELNGVTYFRYHYITNTKLAYSPKFETKQRVEWQEVLPQDPTHKNRTVRGLSKKEVDALGLEIEFLKEYPDFTV